MDTAILSVKSLTWEGELFFCCRIIIAFMLGGIIGWERERVGKEAGIRTFGFISMGACTFSIISQLLNHADPSRIASNVVVGIGFLGAGMIFQEQSKPKGLTTAASLWVSASVGMAIAFDLYVLGFVIAFLTVTSLHMVKARFWKKLSSKRG